VTIQSQPKPSNFVITKMSSSNETTFRSSLNNIGWSRRTGDPDLSTAQPSFFQKINPFGSGNGYIRLPTSSQDLPAQLPAQSAQQENAAWFALSHWERLLVFGCCVLGAAACFVMAFILMPVLVLKPRKFVILWTVGSVLFLCRCVPRVTDVVSRRYRVRCRILNTWFRRRGYRLRPPILAHWR
jgi:hypothetical protein